MYDPKNGCFTDLQKRTEDTEVSDDFIEVLRKWCALGDECVDDCRNCLDSVKRKGLNK
jgi:hypothetical protein